MFLKRIAGGISKPPWSWRAAGLAVLVSFAGFLGLPEVPDTVLRHSKPYLKYLCPVLVWALPMLCCLWYLTRRAGTTVASVFGLRSGRVGPVLVSGILLLLLWLLVAGVTTIGLFRLGFEKGGNAHEAAPVIASSFLLLANVMIWGPLCEELWFRGLLYTSLRTLLGIAPSAIVTAVLFVAVHHPQRLIPAVVLFLVAVLNSLWYERTRSLWPNIIAHSVINALAVFYHARG